VPGILYLILVGLAIFDEFGDTPPPEKVHWYCIGVVERHELIFAVGEIVWFTHIFPKPLIELINGLPLMIIVLSQVTPLGLQTLFT